MDLVQDITNERIPQTQDSQEDRAAQELTDEQIAQEQAFLSGIPRINIGALFLPPIWGPAHGFWATILFYPLWLFADNVFYAAYSEPTTLSVVIALLVLVMLLVGTVAFAIVSQPYAAHKAASRGVTKDDYLHRERIWAVVSVMVGFVMLAAATYYNMMIRPNLGA
jgi:hypothetical protein